MSPFNPFLSRQLVEDHQVAVRATRWRSGRATQTTPAAPTPPGPLPRPAGGPQPVSDRSLPDRWTVVYERTATGWNASVPALRGIATAGVTRAETERLVTQAIEFHLLALMAEGTPIPNPGTIDVGLVELSLRA